MNATTLLNAVKSAQKPAAIGFVTILGLGIATALTTAISTLLALIIPVLLTATKTAIYGYPLFIAGLILIKSQKKAAPKIELLPSCKSFKQQELTQNKVLITQPSLETIFNNHLKPKQPTWQQMMVEEIQQKLQAPIETDGMQTTEDSNSPRLKTTQRIGKPFNQLSIAAICWQAISETSKLLDSIKASEMKSIASELKIPRYRNMNKTQLLIEILTAHENAPEFSQ
jgi:hypothetical protein